MLSLLKELFFGTTIKTQIRVTIINHMDDSIVYDWEVEQYNLPEDFSKLETLTLFGQEWVIVSAEPAHANQYSFSKKLTLRINSKDFLHSRKNIDHPAAGSIIQFGKKSDR